MLPGRRRLGAAGPEAPGSGQLCPACSALTVADGQRRITVGQASLACMRSLA
jgi:hypothetical protein